MLPPIIPVLAFGKLNFGFLEFRITCSFGAPDSQDLYPTVPVIVEDGYVFIAPNKVNLSRLPSDEFAIVSQVARLQRR